MTSLERKWEKQYGIDHRKEKHLTKEDGSTCSESENCDSEIEHSEAPFKVENHKSENAHPLNKNLSDLNQLIQYKEWYTEFDNFTQFLGKVLYSYTTCALILMQHSEVRAKFRIPNWLQSPDIGQNWDGSISDFLISGQFFTKENYYWKENSRAGDDIDMKRGPVTNLNKRKKSTLKKNKRRRHVEKLWCHCHFSNLQPI